MIPIKSKEEILIIRTGGTKLARVMDKAIALVKPGMKLSDLDRFIEELIAKEGAQPSFKMVPNYHWASCLNLKDGVVHGVPDNRVVNDGDLLSIDIGAYFQGFHTDMARTLIVGGQGDSLKNSFLECGKKAMGEAIAVTLVGKRVGDISLAIEKGIRGYGFSPVKALVGHGVGKKLHEPPQIPCFLDRPVSQTSPLRSGMTLAIEVIYTQGREDVCLGSDGWTIKTADGKLAGLIENTVVVGDDGPEVVTDIGS